MAKQFNNDIEVTRSTIENASDISTIYFGVDSERTNIDGVWFVDYLVCVILHEDSCHGASVIYGDVIRERDYDKNLSKPRNRLFTEVLKIAEVYTALQDSFGEKEVEVHLDLNPDEAFGSSCVIQEAIGYIKGVCHIEPKVKPNSFAASIAADRLRNM